MSPRTPPAQHPSAASPPGVPLDLPVAERLQAAIDRYGLDEVVDRAIALLGGANAGEEFLLYAGGRHARGVLDGAPPLYWPEVWGARVLLRAWNESATTAVIAGLGNQSWRVREMCAKVAATHELSFAEAYLPLLTDEVARVRAAAIRALVPIGEIEQARAITLLLADPDIDVRRAAGRAISDLEAKLDRPIR